MAEYGPSLFKCRLGTSWILLCFLYPFQFRYYLRTCKCVKFLLYFHYGKEKFYSVTLLICLFLFITSIPLERVISSSWVLFSIQIALRLAFFIFALYYIHKEELSPLSFKRLKSNTLLILPFLLLCFSNYFVALVQNSPRTSFSTEFIIQSISVYAFTALNEELIFRGVLFPLFKKGILLSFPCSIPL